MVLVPVQVRSVMPSLTSGRIRPSLRHVRQTGEFRGSSSGTRIRFYCCCFPVRERRTVAASACGQEDSLLSKYGLDELSDTDGEGEVPDNPMSPEQIARMRERQQPLTHVMRVCTVPLLAPACYEANCPPLTHPLPVRSLSRRGSRPTDSVDTRNRRRGGGWRS